MRLKKIAPLIFVLTILAGHAAGQIFSPEASDSFGASYNGTAGTDKVFIYNSEIYQQGSTGAIIAVSEDRQTGWNFDWSVYDPAAHAYIPIPGSSSGMSSVLDTLTVSSGYQVIMTKGSVTSVYRVWLAFNDFQVNITNKDADNNLQFGYYNCSSLDLRADTTAYPSYYYNPVTGARIKIPIGYIFRWSTDNPEAGTPPSQLITRVSHPPVEDTWYTITVTDRFKLVRSDSVFYKSIQSRAKIAASYVELGDSGQYPPYYKMYYRDGGGDENKSAPGKYRFDISASRNSSIYQINFGDEGTLETDTTGTEIIHEYEKPGDYTVILTTKSDKPYECVSEDSVVVHLGYGIFVMPNVFSPDQEYTLDNYEAGENDIFRSEDVSVVIIEITIFDRAGRKMHEYSGDMREWKGWDGLVMKSERKAPEGVYYWAVSTLIYFRGPEKEDPIKKEVYSGFFHLYRQ